MSDQINLRGPLIYMSRTCYNYDVYCVWSHHEKIVEFESKYWNLKLFRDKLSTKEHAVICIHHS